MRAIIIEDSRLARLELKELLKDFPEIELVGEAENAEEGKALIEKENPDILFLDIHMPGKDGFELLQELETVPHVIFTTAFNEYAIKSFEFNTIDYLLKPISSERLGKAIAKASDRISVNGNKSEKLNEESRVFVKDGEKCWFVTVKDIRLLVGQGNYTQVYFDNNKPMVLKSLQHFENVLDDSVFIRANRQQIINLKYVEGGAAWFNGRLKLKLTSGEEIEVSRRQTEKIKKIFSF